MNKPLLVAVPLIAALGPMLYHSASQRLLDLVKSSTANIPGSAPATPPKPAKEPAPAPKEPEAPVAVHPLELTLRFDVTPQWVTSQWPRVSAGLGYLQLQGYRVPLVTGTGLDDLAGSLTYYFRRDELQRITFQGTTGDYRRLCLFLTSHYGFRYRPTNSPGVFIYEGPATKGQEGTSFLWIEPSKIMKAEEARRRFDLTLVVDRPS